MNNSGTNSSTKHIIDFLKSADNFLITAHMNADGDAYASMLAMAYLLKEWNKSYRLILNDQQLEEKYAFMWGFEQIESYDPDKQYKFNYAIAVDVPSRQRMGEIADILPAAENCIKVDHHPVEDNFAKYQFVDVAASSSSQLVYEVIKDCNLPMTDDLANLLFSGIMYDTGRFSFSNTNIRDFQVAADLLKNNVNPHQIANRLFFDNTFEALHTLGYGLSKLESHLDGQVAIIYLPLEIMEKTNHSEIEDLANFPVSIKGVEVGLFIREIKPGFFKVSFRSKGRLNVNNIAQDFDGGGHDHAAGCRFEGEYEKLHDGLIEAIRKRL